MWMVNPRLLCRKHLLGEHGEIHKHRHNFVKQHSISKRVSPVVQIEPANMKKRHDELAEEMLRRGFNHNSPFEQPDISYLPEEEQHAQVNISIACVDLIERCPSCAKNILI